MPGGCTLIWLQESVYAPRSTLLEAGTMALQDTVQEGKRGSACKELYPIRTCSSFDLTSESQTVDFTQVPFSAIFVFHDSRNWGFDSQIMLDVLMSPDGVVKTWRDPQAGWEQRVPVFFSNPDLLWVRYLHHTRVL